MSLLNIFEESNSAQLFILNRPDEVTSHNLNSGIKKRKEQLQNLGIQKGHKVILCLGNSAEFCETLFAVWELDACAVPLSSSSTENEIAVIAELIGPALIVDAHGTDIIKSENFTSTDGDFLILHTSGSSGSPKGVSLSRDAVVNKIKIYQKYLPMEDFKNTLCMLPLNFGHGLISNFLFPFLSGQNVYLTPSGNMDIYGQLGIIIDEYKITTFSSVPSILKIASNFSDRPLNGSLKKIYCASAALDKETWQTTMEWSSEVPFCNMYGLTEMASWIASSNVSKDKFDENVFNLPWEAELKIVKQDDNDEFGEIFLKSDSMMEGYFRNSTATEKVLQEDWFKTGDLGLIENEKLILKGRIDDVINIGGIKIYPQEINQEIKKHPKIADCFSFGLRLKNGGEYTIACVLIPIEGQFINFEEIRNFCKKNLSSYKIPSQYKLIDKFPLNQRGKIDSKVMRTLFITDTENN